MPRRDADQPGTRRPPRAPTIADVAAAAGVSRSAVSRTFTAGASASADTRARVQAAAEALRYRPNLVARSLTTQRSNVVAIGTARLDNGFNAELLQAIALRLDAAGLRPMLFPTAGDLDGDPPIDAVLRHRVDAVMLLATPLSSHFAEACAAAGVPLVQVNRTSRSATVSTVSGDNVGGARAVAEFLLAGGHARFAFMAGIEDSSTSRDRERGYGARLREARLPAPLRAVGHYDAAHAVQAMRDLLRGPARPDAVFCANDHMAAVALDVARREFGLTVGRDLSVVGFDDATVAGLSGIELTTFSQPFDLMAKDAVEALIGLMRDPSLPAIRRVVAGRLVVRRSARLPSAAWLRALAVETVSSSRAPGSGTAS